METMAETLRDDHRQLLTHLRQNSREKLTSISQKTNIPISTLFDMLKELQETLITKSTVLLDYAQLGYHTHAQVFLKVSVEQKEGLKKHLYLHPQVNSIYKINNGWDFMVETVHKNIKDLDGFLESLDKFKVEGKQVHYLIDEVKKEGFLIS